MEQVKPHTYSNLAKCLGSVRFALFSVSRLKNVNIKLAFLICFVFINKISESQNNVNEKKPIPTASSFINMPIKIGYDKIDAFLDSQMLGILYLDSTSSSYVKVMKHGKLAVAGKVDSAEIVLPVRVWYSKKVGPVEFGVDFDLKLVLSLKVALSRDWMLLTKTRLVRYEVTRQPVARLSTLKWDFGFVLNQILKYSLPKITAKVDQELAKSDLVSSYAKTIWAEVQRPMLVDSTYNAWMSMHPSRFYYLPVRFLKKDMQINAAMDYYLNFGLGRNLPSKPISFSKLELKDSLPHYFSTKINLSMPVANIDSVVKMVLKDSVFTVSGRKKIKIEDVSMKQNENGRIACKIVTSGNYRLELLLEADLAFNDSLQELYAKNIGYSVSSKQLLVKTADGLFGEFIKKKLGESLRYDLRKDVEISAHALSKFFDNYNYLNKVLVKGEIKEMNVKDVKCESNTVTGILNVMGKAQVTLIGVK